VTRLGQVMDHTLEGWIMKGVGVGNVKWWAVMTGIGMLDCDYCKLSLKSLLSRLFHIWVLYIESTAELV